MVLAAGREGLIPAVVLTMPGLFGVIDSNRASSEDDQRQVAAIVRRMAAAMRYDETYVEGAVECVQLGAHAGCIAHSGDRSTENSESTSTHRPLVLVTGEAAFRPKGQSAEEILREIDGQCAAFICDLSSEKCFVCNDRYGRERIFIFRDRERTFFSSEAKAILAVAPRTRAFDPVGVAELLACGSTLGAHSLYRDIEVLEPGTVVTFSRSQSPLIQRRWTPQELELKPPLDAAGFREGFSTALHRAVNDSVNASPSVGVSLTGGLDSRMIMASLDAAPGSVPCYTFGSMYRTTADVATARLVAARCGQPHSVIELGQTFIQRFPDFLEQSVYISDGYLGFSGAAELYVNRQARSIARARMTGNWGGELLRGVRAFKYNLPKGDFVLPELTQLMTASAAKFAMVDPNPLTAALFQQMPLQGYGRYAIERSQMVTRSPFLACDVIEMLYRAPAAARESRQVASAVISRRPELLTIPTDLGLLGTKRSVLRHVSRRARVKAEYLTSHGAPDWLANLSARLPASVLEARFLGVDKFQHFRFWTRRYFADLLRDTFRGAADSSLGAHFDMRRVRAMVEDHVSGRANYNDELDKLVTLTLAEKVLLGRDGRGAVELPASEASPTVCH